jgi:LPS export ABC transporter protein LptC
MNGWYVIAVIVLLHGFGVSGCQTKEEDLLKAARKDTLPVERLHNAEIFYRDSFQLKAILMTPLMERYHGDQPRTVMPHGVKLRFFNRHRQVTTSLTAGWAISREHDRIMEARNDVVVVNEKNEILNTEHLIWDERTRRIRSDAFVRIRTHEEIIFGEGLDASEDFSWYQIRNVKGTITLKE